MPEWTTEQKNAIETKGGTLLVSAAAGSGKTAVLVERIIRRLSDTENPLYADRLLIVTFTRAAAAEMKFKIEKALRSEIRKPETEPEVRRLLKKQQVLLQNASISTVDSFCVKLTREFFYELGINENYKILDEQQKNNLTAQAIKDVIDRYFEGTDHTLADVFSDDRNDRKLIAAILKLYEYTRSHLFPEQWMEETGKLYSADGSVKDNLWGRALMTTVNERIDYCISASEECLKTVSAENLGEKLLSCFSDLNSSLIAVSRKVKESDWNGIRSMFDLVTFQSRFPTPRGMANDPVIKKVHDLYDEIKKTISAAAGLFIDTEETVKSDIARTGLLYNRLSDLVKQFSDRYDELKQKMNAADYSDIEHWTVKLLINQDRTKTKLAEELSARFDEIMIDEYQDTNEVQDEIFRALSSDNDSNRFMVGDLKQSIYGFRLAMPEIFLRYKKSFSRFSEGNISFPTVINLDRNFRSGPEVIDTVNFFFGLLMTESSCGVDYRDGEELRQGRNIAPDSKNNTELIFIEKGSDVEATSIELEAAVIAKKIKDMISSGFTVTDGDSQRPAIYSDFCILMRSANKTASKYAEMMNKNGVPTHASLAGNFFDQPEITVFLSLLRVIDNPNQDIPLLSALMGPVFGYTADDLASLRLINRKDSLYTAILKDESGKFTPFLEKLKEYRRAASVMPAPVFIRYLYSALDYENISRVFSQSADTSENLSLLIHYAEIFESGDNVGLSGFVRFINRVEESGSTLESANTLSENENVVRIMTIHKSKGLEYPVCFIADCGKDFKIDRDSVALNKEYGFGCRLINSALRVTYSNLMRDVIVEQNMVNQMTEELRVLYVAMTRAKEKLIMVSTVSDLGKHTLELAVKAGTENAISSYSTLNVKRISDWILLCASRNPFAAKLREFVGMQEYTPASGALYPWNISIYSAEEARNISDDPEAEVHPVNTEIDEELLRVLQKYADFNYPYAGKNDLPVRITASSLSHEDPDSTMLSRPAFMSRRGLTPTERGTAFHNYLQFCDFKAASADPSAELERIVSSGYITKEQGAAIDLNLVNKFFFSEIGREALSAEKLEKEYRFSVSLRVSELPDGVNIGEADENTTLILQGAIDLYYIYNDEVTLLDFKTDNVSSMEELKTRYSVQIELYRTALEKILGKKIKKSVIYSIKLTDFIEI